MATQPVAIQSPRDLFFYDLCVMYDIEQKLVNMLPVMAQECVDQQASDTFNQHLQETQQHIRNLEQCFQILGGQPMALENHTIAGLKQDHDTFMQQQQPIEAVTLFDLHAGYQSECLEIAAYHNLIDEANSLGLQDCAQLFQQNLQQEINASKKLADIAHQYELQQVQMVQRVTTGGVMPNQSYASPDQQTPNQPYTDQQMQGQPYGAMPVQPLNQGSNQSVQQPHPSNQTSGTANQQMSPASQLQQGMQVVGSDMGKIGNVKDIRENDFLIDIPMQRDIYAPFNAIQNVNGDQVILNVPTGQIQHMNWPNPPLT